jgi:hypothetical protein
MKGNVMDFLIENKEILLVTLGLAIDTIIGFIPEKYIKWAGIFRTAYRKFKVKK